MVNFFVDIFYALNDNLVCFVVVNLVFICGSRDGLMTVTGRKHNADGKLR